MLGKDKKKTRFAEGTPVDDKSEQDDGSNRGSARGSTTAGGDSNNDSNANEVACELRKLAGKDNRNVRIWKFMLVVVIAIAGALVSTGIYFYLKFQEDEEIKDSVSLDDETDTRRKMCSWRFHLTHIVVCVLLSMPFTVWFVCQYH